MLSLPPEICALIATRVQTKDLAHLARTSRAMLNRLVPYLWEDVKAGWLLVLLPGANFGPTRYSTLPLGQITTPIPLPTNYLDRFLFYSQHVKSIYMGSDWHHLKIDLHPHQLAWPSVLSYASTRVLFPNLRKLHLAIYNETTPVPWDWAALFIVPTLTNIRCDIPARADQKLSRMLNSILSTCLGLERMILSTYGGEWPWDRIASSPVPRSLKSLKVVEGVMSHSFLNWAGQMPQLEELDLQPHWWERNGATTLSSVEFPPESFPALALLAILRADKNLLAQLCLTPVVTHLTKLAVEIITGDVATTQLFSHIAAKSPSLQEFECCGYFYLANSDIASLHPLSLRSLKLWGTDKEGPELDISTLSGLSSKLEVLELSSYVSLWTIMCLPLHLPHLEVLGVCIDPQAIPNTVDTSHLSGASLERMRILWRTHPFTLTITCGQWENPEPAKLDICSKMLAMTWPCMNLHFGGPEYSMDPVPHAPLIEKKVAYYSELVLQNGRLI
ncbi:hypothetical protein BDV93DRAFT_607486 [Ceratobasidium sp. AG-I]|nr:hypothetical protein BDV93DRAFT_607486 [Ceratobasidium sp. AG-I]